jgi:transcriptional regulator with GAF, ATPase, and Fis domain/tetratricopeptide (TPR) repeat protein
MENARMRNKPAIRSQEATEAAQVEHNLALEAMKVGDSELAWSHLQHVLDRLSGHLLDAKDRSLFVRTSLEFSNLCLGLGRGFDQLKPILEKARAVSEDIGDRRSRALTSLHLGRLHYLGNRIPESMGAFSEGKAGVEELGDEDIRVEAAEFIGMYYFAQGRFAEARPHLDEAARSFEAEELRRPINLSAPLWLALCSFYLAQFHDAIGTADYYYRLSLARSDLSQACMLQATLGLFLSFIDRRDEAGRHLSSALDKAVQTENALAIAFAKAGIGRQYYREGRLHEARDWIAQGLEESHASGLMLEYGSDLLLETAFELAQEGVEPISPFDMDRELKRIMRQPNIHLRGVALRLSAIAAADRGENEGHVESLLQSSEKYLKQSGDPVQLAKTRLELARLKLNQGDEDKARLLARKAWKGFSGYGEVLYPDDLRDLLEVKRGFSPERDSRPELFEMFVNMIHDMKPSPDVNGILTRTVASTSRFFGAERGGVFWFPRRGGANRPVLRAGHNLSPDDVSTKEFRWSLSLISKAYRENTPLLIQNEGMSLSPTRVMAVLCAPFEVEGRVQGVLYHDNSHVPECFEAFEISDLVRIARSLASFVEHLVELSQQVQQRTSSSLTRIWQSDSREIVTGNPQMLEILAQLDHIAGSDGTVLITGETGAGKELFANRLHEMSGRREGPFVIVDPTTIPETLVESELFGHEKGAFTGAERQKPGRLELANGGTLFIDEVGEIPKSVQAKLLRALQEKTLVRVGGTITLRSDFRLVAATNRDLAREVAAGRFREDLYYRINVVPLAIPPLRERKEDIPLLAKYFLAKYASRYGRPEIELTKKDEAKLMGYDWPGNVRELENVVERTVLLSMGEELEFRLPAEDMTVSRNLFSDYPTLDEMQRRYIQQVLEKTGGKIGGPGGAAEILGMKRTTLNDRMRKLGLR